MMKTGICIAGPAWIVRNRSATPAAHIDAIRLTSSASTISPNRSTPLPLTCIPLASGDDEQQIADRHERA